MLTLMPAPGNGFAGARITEMTDQGQGGHAAGTEKQG